MRLPDGRQYLLTMTTTKSQTQPSVTTVTQATASQSLSTPLVLGQKIVLQSQAMQTNTPRFVVTGNTASASKPVFVVGTTPNAQILPTLGRPRLVTATQQQPTIIRMTSGQQVMLRPQRPAIATPRSVAIVNDPAGQPVGFNLLSPSKNQSSGASSSYAVTPQVVQQGASL